MTMSEDFQSITLIIGILLTIITSILVIRRMNLNDKKNEKGGCLVNGVIFILMSFPCIFSSLLLPQTIFSTINYIDYPRYEGRVVDIESKWEEESYTDDDNHTRTIDVLKHRAVLEFTDNKGREIRQLNPMSFDEKPNIGTSITVSYKNGHMQEYSFRAIAILLLTIVILIVMIYILIRIFRYIIGKK